jgi:hypothetical protein
LNEENEEDVIEITIANNLDNNTNMSKGGNDNDEEFNDGGSISDHD